MKVSWREADHEKGLGPLAFSLLGRVSDIRSDSSTR
jgi:hypothetical protein